MVPQVSDHLTLVLWAEDPVNLFGYVQGDD